MSIFRYFSKFSNNIAIVTPDKSITYAELLIMTDTRATALRKSGVRKGSVICFVQPTDLALVIDILALWRIGAVAGLVNHHTPPKTRHKICRLMPKYLPPRLNVATVMATSGSTGEGKLVAHSHENHFSNAQGSNHNIVLKPGDRWLLSLPLFHVSGIAILWRCLISGAAIAFPDKLTLERAITKLKITHISMVPTQLFRMLRHPAQTRTLKKLKCILLGGAPIPKEQMSITKKLNLRVFPTYGLTEMASQVATSKRPFGAMFPLKGRSLKTKNGTILVKGRPLFLGYWGKGKFSRPLDRQGWFNTNDLGTYSPAKGLQVVGRNDTMFISGGENIFPEEIERMILSTGMVATAVVIGTPDPEYGKVPVAFIAPYRRVNELKKKLSQKLPALKIPRRFYPVPKNLRHSGIKLSRKRLSLFLNGR